MNKDTSNLRDVLDPVGTLSDQQFIHNYRQLLLSPPDSLLEQKQKVALFLIELLCGSLMDHSHIQSLPIESSIWCVKRKMQNGHILREINDQSGRTIAITTDDFLDSVSKHNSISNNTNGNTYNSIQEVLSCLYDTERQVGAQGTCSSTTTDYISMLCAACLSPLVGRPRRPLAIYDRHFPQVSSQVSQMFPFPVSKEMGCVCTLRPRGVPFRSCHLCGYQAEDSMLATCSRCGVVFYCSDQCASQDTIHNQEQCDKIQYYKQITPQLTDLPFTFTELVCSDRFDDAVVSDYLKEQGIYNLGMWIRESPACLHCSSLPAYGELDVSLDPYVLPCEGMILEDITAAPLEPLSSWEDYYTWRGFDFSSPIAVLMHTVLTVYHIIQMSGMTDRQSLRIVLGAVDKEADLVMTLFELSVLLPDKHIDIIMVGPLISDKLSGSKVEHGNLSVTRLSTTLQDYIRYSSETDSIDLIICLNAGLAAYPSWKEAVLTVAEKHIKCYITDFCLLSLDMSQQALNSLLPLLQPSLDSLSLSDSQMAGGGSQTVAACPRLSEPLINPFRNPFRKYCDSARLAWFSNAFICELRL